MTYDPNATWTAAVGARTQAPIYFLRISGLSTDYSTGPVRSPTTTIKTYLELPVGGGSTIDVLSGRYSVQTLSVELLDVDGEITDLIATEAAGAPLSTLINRAATLYSGDRSFTQSSYAPVWSGRITGLELVDGTRYRFELSSSLSKLAGKIMSNATDEEPTVVRGNPLNLYWSILTGTFSTSGDFPLEFVSTDVDTTLTVAATTGDDELTVSDTTGFSAGDAVRLVDGATTEAATIDTVDSGTQVTLVATIGNDYPIGAEFKLAASTPTGLGIPSAEVNGDQIAAERDRWYPTTVVELVETSELTTPGYLSSELFRIFQCFPAIDATGRIGIRTLLPALPLSAVPVLDSEILKVKSWRRRYDLHLNSFTYRGDYDAVDDEYDTTFDVPVSSDDTADQTATGETIEYVAESRWLRTLYDGETEARALANRLRLRYRKTPVELELDIDARGVNLEQGDIVAVTHPNIPDLLTGTMGSTERLMVVERVRVDWNAGVVQVRALDSGWTRYSVISPTGTADYGSATAGERVAFGWIGDATTNEVGSGDPGYVVI